MASVEGILDLAEVDNECGLGVKFMSNLQSYKHVTNICAMANRTVGITKHTFSDINIDMFRVLPKSLNHFAVLFKRMEPLYYSVS